MHEIDGDLIGPQSSCNGSASKWGFAFRGSNLRLVAALVTKCCLGVISHEVKVFSMRKVTNAEIECNFGRAVSERLLGA